MGLVVTKQWTAGTVISVEDHVKMLVLDNLSLVQHEDIGLELLKPYGSIMQQSIKNEQISNIENFNLNMMSEMTIGLEIQILGSYPNALKEYELMRGLYQGMKSNTLGCGQQCPLCRKMCD